MPRAFVWQLILDTLLSVLLDDKCSFRVLVKHDGCKIWLLKSFDGVCGQYQEKNIRRIRKRASIRLDSILFHVSSATVSPRMVDRIRCIHDLTNLGSV